MRMHPYLFFGLGSRFWTTYRIENGIAYTETWLGRKSSIPLNGAKFDALGSVLPFGDIVIRSGGESLELRRVRERKAVLAGLDRARIGQDASMPIATAATGPVPTALRSVPPTAQLSNQVLIMPAMPRGFEILFGKPKPLAKSYDWVERGQVVAEVEIDSGATLQIFAPVSGVVLHGFWHFAWNPDDYAWRFSILMEKSSRTPKPIPECFAGIEHACRQAINIAIEKRAYSASPGEIRVILEEDIAKFSSTPYQIDDLRPKFDEYITHMQSSARENYEKVPRE